MIVAAAGIVFALAALVAVRLWFVTPAAPADGPVDQDTLAALSGVPPQTFEAIGAGTA